MTLKLKYITHNHSACLLAYHFVTTTKMRRPELEGITLDLFRLALKKHAVTIHVGEIMPDHCHLLVQTPATYSPAYIAKLIKGCSSRLISKQLKDGWSGWSVGYFISTTGGAAVEAVKAYIENQMCED